MEKPYKLCDYKPAYGEALQSLLSEYDFWGYCDCDLILGDLRKFLTEDILQTNDKLFTRGHMTLFRNTPEVNAFYRTQTVKPLREVYTSGRSFSFDEWAGISSIWEQQGRKYYDQLIMDDIRVGLEGLSPTKTISGIGGPYHPHNVNEASKYRRMRHIVYSYRDGTLKRNWLQDGKCFCEEVLYVHLQKRAMSVEDGLLNADEFLIRDGCFIRYCDINKDNIKHLSGEKFSIHNIKFILKGRLRRAVERFLKQA